MLQVQSRNKCRRVFGQVDQWIEESIAHSLSLREEDRAPLLDKYARVRTVTCCRNFMIKITFYKSWFVAKLIPLFFSFVTS